MGSRRCRILAEEQEGRSQSMPRRIDGEARRTHSAKIRASHAGCGEFAARVVRPAHRCARIAFAALPSGADEFARNAIPMPPAG